MTVRDLELMALKNLSSFDGFDGGNFYTGQGDPYLDFQGEGKNFATIGQNDMQFIVNIKNTHSTETRRVLLIPGWDFNPMDFRLIPSSGTAVLAPKAGVLSESTAAANLLDLDSKANLVVSGAPKALDLLYKWLDENPTALGAMRVSSTDSNQVMQTITYRKLSPFKDLETSIINLGMNQSEDTYRDKLVTVQTPGMILSKQTQLEMIITPNSTCVITFFFGGSLNPSKLMQHKVNEAVRTIRTYSPQIVANSATIGAAGALNAAQ